MAWYRIFIKHFLEVCHGVSHLSLVSSRYTHSPKRSCVYRENASDSWDIPKYTTRKRWITSIYLLGHSGGKAIACFSLTDRLVFYYDVCPSINSYIFSNSLIIHLVKTKEIRSVKAVWKSDLN